jgi:Domain of unknown function (DUF4136)
MRVQHIALLVVLSACAFGQKVKIDYDKEADFRKIKTYTWVRGTPVPGPAMDAYIHTSIDQELKNHGLKKVPPEEADVFITYYAIGNTNFSVSGLDDPLFASVGGVPLDNWTVWYSGPAFATAARYIRKGSLSLHMFDKSKHRLIWAATAEGTVNERMDKRLDQLDKVTTRMFKDFPPTGK